jgi:hypothetical protein
MNTHQNAQDVLDAIKLRISREVLAAYSVSEIKKRSMENIERWRSNGVTGSAYDEWTSIIQDPDDFKMVDAMTGLSERSNRLRLSSPYVGILPQAVVIRIKEEIISNAAHLDGDQRSLDNRPSPAKA